MLTKDTRSPSDSVCGKCIREGYAYLDILIAIYKIKWGLAMIETGGNFQRNKIYIIYRVIFPQLLYIL